MGFMGYRVLGLRFIRVHLSFLRALFIVCQGSELGLGIGV